MPVARTAIGRVRMKNGSTRDGFANFEAALGLGADNQMSASRYTLRPLTRNWQELDNMYRSSWVVRRAVDVPAEDMTRAGVDFAGLRDGLDVRHLQNTLRRTNTWGSLSSAICNGRLYGGAIAVIMIEGQDLAEPLDLASVGKGQYRGLLPINRWSLSPSGVVTELGPMFGKPAYYEVQTGYNDLPRGAIHYSRVMRFEGDDLPYTQRQYENGWGASIVESFHDRLVAFDSTTLGMAQLVYKAHLRTLRMKDLRKNIAEGGKAYAAALTNVDLIRRYQSNEGLTLIDIEDEFKADTYTFGGLSDVMIQFSQQIAGAVRMPLVKFFGMSPAGFSTGDADLRSYNDDIHLKQERHLRHPMEVGVRVAYHSTYGEAPPEEFGFEFTSLYGLNSMEKADIAGKVSTALATAEGAQAIGKGTMLRELKASSETTGIFATITDADIAKADAEDLVEPLPELPTPDNESATSSISEGDGPDDREEFDKRPFPLRKPALAAA